MIAEQLHIWHKTTIQNYDQIAQLNVTKLKIKSNAYFQTNSNASVNHPVTWANLNSVTLHSTSNKLLINQVVYGSFSLALSCAGGQTPKPIKTKQSVAAFKMVKASLTSTCVNLRTNIMYEFCYKWAFLAPGVVLTSFGREQKQSATNSSKAIGIEDVFIFPELDPLDYYAFESVTGLDINFHSSKRVRFKNSTLLVQQD